MLVSFRIAGVVQKINILIMNQSVIDMFGSLFALLNAVVEVDGSNMSRDSAIDQFVCRIWMTRSPLWCLLLTSSYSVILTALERYVAVVYPVFYKVSILFSYDTISSIELKVKGSPYSITERRVPELIPVLGSQSAGDVSHKPGGRLPFLSAPGLQLPPPQPLRGLLPILLLDEQTHNGCEPFA